MLRMNACLLPTVDSDVDNLHFTHYSGYGPDTHAVSWLLTAVVRVISGFSSADPRVSRPSS
ncbi:hypothetical protein EFF40_17505 [Salmonella enterica]|uniref:Uncharacterized protein n=3 Tax=Salmonella enterica TaxID=28901 RepID=A0A5T7QIN3_SALER|nr:hypothetical protein [Salmonella enterica subsp. enterica serovar Typhi]EAB4910125.1 hypothetical protein [Salmonella enterica]ECC9834458.1 hypothetical protein [Salmonella enterica subsp. enterica serovar Paratyphi A]HAD4537667.1 hypothetical protein [Salmonella enterica subsp. enterica serovar Typhi str. CT18]HAD7831274.1 hypothetical protein [Salmonella enterica subsp. enterica serovar Typhi str. 404ty]